MPKSIRGVLHEFKEGALHSGSSTGKVVTNRKQAIAIALSEQRQRGASVAPAPNSYGQRAAAGGANGHAHVHPGRNLGKFLHPRGGK